MSNWPDFGKSRILTNWQPSRYDDLVIAIEFRELIQNLFSIEVGSENSSKKHHLSTYHYNHNIYSETDAYGANAWHQDYIGALTSFLIVWSHRVPVEVRYIFDKKQELKATDGDVLLLNNLEVEHRSPSTEKDRWLARLVLY